MVCKASASSKQGAVRPLHCMSINVTCNPAVMGTPARRVCILPPAMINWRSPITAWLTAPHPHPLTHQQPPPCLCLGGSLLYVPEAQVSAVHLNAQIHRFEALSCTEHSTV